MDWLPPWSLIEGALRSLIFPTFAGAAVVFAVVCAVTKRTEVRIVGGVLALIAGLATGNHFRELLEWWPVESPSGEAQEQAPSRVLARGWDALLPVTVAALALCLAAALLFRRAGWLFGMSLRVIVAAGVAWWLGEALPPYSKTATSIMLFAGMAFSHEALLFASGRTLRRISLVALTVPWSATAAAVLIFAHSARFSDLGGLMMASLCGVGLIAAVWEVEPAALFAGPAAFIPPLMLAGAANTYSEVPIAAFACVAFAPCALCLLRLPPLTRLHSRAFAAVAVALVLIPCAVAVAMAAWMEDLNYGE